MRWKGVSLKGQDLAFLNYARTYLVLVVACLAWKPYGGLSEERYGLVIRRCGRVTSTGTTSVWRVDEDCSLYCLGDEPVLQAAFFRQLDDADLIEVLH